MRHNMLWCILTLCARCDSQNRLESKIDINKLLMSLWLERHDIYSIYIYWNYRKRNCDFFVHFHVFERWFFVQIAMPKIKMDRNVNDELALKKPIPTMHCYAIPCACFVDHGMCQLVIIRKKIERTNAHACTCTWIESTTIPYMWT